MKVLEATGVGIDAFRIVERSQGEVAANEVRIRAKAASLNFADLLCHRDNVQGVVFPRVPLADVAGEVVEIGSDVRAVAVGERVFASHYPDWISGPMTVAKRQSMRHRGRQIDGVAAEYLVLRAEELIPMPAHLSYVEAATLPCAALTAWVATTQAGLKPGASVLLQGTGGVSLFALQFALAAGAETWLISSSDAKLERAKALGLHHGLNYSQTPNWGSAIAAETGGRGMDLIVDMGGPTTINHSLEALAQYGRIAQVGVLDGRDASYSIYQMLVKMAQIFGVACGSRDTTAEMAHAVDVHKIHPVVDRVFELDELPGALRLLESQKFMGKIVVKIS